MALFRSNEGTPVYVTLADGGRLAVDAALPYETTKRDEIAALRAATNVSEEKEAPEKAKKKDDD